MQKNLRTSFIGILILIIGVIVGVVLVKQTQIFKNQAKDSLGNGYTVCHKTGDTEDPWQEIKVSAEELPTFLNAGDIFGECTDDKLE